MSNKRIEKIREKLDDIILKAQKRNIRFAIPEIVDRMKIRETIKDFVKDKKRIIYGGSAIDFWLKKKNLSIYDEELPGDIEFYSPFPLEDMYKLCNKLKKMGFKNVVGRQALHHDTFSIFVEYVNFCDLTYMNPVMMKNNIPHYSEDGLTYVKPEFLINDMYRVFANPLHDYPFRLKKVFERFILLKENYFTPPEKPSICPPGSKQENKLVEMKDQIFDKFVLNNMDVILCGSKAYNYYLEYSGYLKKNSKVYQPPENDPLVLVINGQDFKKCFEEIIRITEKDGVKVKEYTKFFQFYDRKLVIEYEGKECVVLIGNNGICTQYHKMQPDDSDGFFQLCSYDYLMIYLNSLVFRYYTEAKLKKQYQCMIHYLDLMRDYYLNKKKLIGVEEDNIFSHFILECRWSSLSEIYKSKERIKKRFIKNIKPITYEYRPDTKIVTKSPDIVYTNSSGNQIINLKNLVIKDKQFLPNNIKK